MIHGFLQLGTCPTNFLTLPQLFLPPEERVCCSCPVTPLPSLTPFSSPLQQPAEDGPGVCPRLPDPPHAEGDPAATPGGRECAAWALPRVGGGPGDTCPRALLPPDLLPALLLRSGQLWGQLQAGFNRRDDHGCHRHSAGSCCRPWQIFVDLRGGSRGSFVA